MSTLPEESQVDDVDQLQEDRPQDLESQPQPQDQDQIAEAIETEPIRAEAEPEGEVDGGGEGGEAEPEAEAEAEEEGGEEAEEQEVKPSKKKKNKNKPRPLARGLIDEEVEVSSDEQVSGDEDDEEEDGMLKDLIAEEEEIGPRKKKKSKGKRKRRIIEELAEDDYELVESAMGIKLRRNVDEDVIHSDEDEQNDNDSKKRQRLKKTQATNIQDFNDSIDNTISHNLDTNANNEMDDFVVNDVDDDFGEGKGKTIKKGGNNNNNLAGQNNNSSFIVDENDESTQDGLNLDYYDNDDDQSKKSRLRALFGTVSDFFANKQNTQKGVQFKDSVNLRQEKQRESVVTTKVNKLWDQFKVIRDTDIPERLQERDSQFRTLYPSDYEQDQAINFEADWIRSQFFNDDHSVFDSICQVLIFIKKDLLEIPYIARYRKDFYEPLTEDDLWRIDALDQKWELMSSKRIQLLQRVQALLPGDERLILSLRETISTSSDLDDIQDYLDYYTAQEKALKKKLLSDQKKSGMDYSNSNTDNNQGLTQSQEYGLTQIEMSQEDNLNNKNFQNPAAAASIEDKKIPFNSSTSDRVKAVLSSSLPKKQSTALMQALLSCGLHTISSKIGLSARQFGENLVGVASHSVTDCFYDLEEAAAKVLSNHLYDIKDVISSARQLLALDISNDVYVRQWVRDYYHKNALVSTEPTVKGILQINDSHQYACVKRLTNKPLFLFLNSIYASTQFILIDEAEKEGFIKVFIEIIQSADFQDTSVPRLVLGSSEDPLRNNLVNFYVSRGRSSDAMLWNDQRSLVITESVTQHLHRIGVNFIRETMLTAAHEHVIERAELKLDRLLRSGKFECTGPQHTRKVISIVIGNDPSSDVSIVALDEFGFLLETLYLSKLTSQAKASTGQSDASEAERREYLRKKEDQIRFLNFCSFHTPQLIVLNPNGSPSRFKEIKQDLETKIVQFYPNPIMLVDPTVARAVALSNCAKNEFKEQKEAMRQAISQGRFALDPITEICSLWSNPDMTELLDATASSSLKNDEKSGFALLNSISLTLKNDILALNLHPLQNTVPAKALMHALQRRLVRVVSHLGVDMNRILRKPWLTAPLQFVCGLGPLKAKNVLDQFKSLGYQVTRSELIDGSDDGSKPPSLKQRVYRNAAGFIVIKGNVYDKRRAKLMNKFEESRIHPEHYHLANAIVTKVLTGQPGENYVNEPNASDLDGDQTSPVQRKRNIKIRQNTKLRRALEKVSKPGKPLISQLDLVAYADKETEGELLEVMRDIVTEIMHPFFDDLYNVPLKPIPDTKLFTLLTGETYATLRIGMTVPATIRHITADGVKCIVKGKIHAFIPLPNLSDSSLIEVPCEDREQMIQEPLNLQPGKTVNARIVKLDLRILSFDVRDTADLSIKDSDMKRWNKQRLDECINKAKDAGCEIYDDSDLEQWHLDDPYLYFNDNMHPDEVRLLKEEESKKVVVKIAQRTISHPNFQNWDQAYTEKELLLGPTGEVLIRPGRNYDSLMLSWKVSNGCCWHIQVDEKDKRNRPEDIGSKLFIHNHQFEDLDEIIVKYCNPIIKFSNNVLKYKNFTEETDQNVLKNRLRVERMNQPRSIPYFITFAVSNNKIHACHFVFNFIEKVQTGDNLAQLPFKVTPKGYNFDSHDYSDFLQMLSAIKNKIRSRVPSSSSNRSRDSHSSRDSGARYQSASSSRSSNGARNSSVSNSRWGASNPYHGNNNNNPLPMLPIYNSHSQSQTNFTSNSRY